MSGEIICDTQIEFETYGLLNDDSSNVIVVCHGYGSNHHVSGFYNNANVPVWADNSDPGWWSDLIGPGKAIDTDRYFVVSSNTLGSCYGSTGPGSMDPISKSKYGKHFPSVSISDMVQAQYKLLTRLGVTRVTAVIGISYGGYLAFEWAAAYPAYIDSAVVIASGMKGLGSAVELKKLRERFFGAEQPVTDFVPALVDYRVECLHEYGIVPRLVRAIPDKAARNKFIQHRAQQWATHFDVQALLTLRQAAIDFDIADRITRITAKILYVFSSSDRVFPRDRALEDCVRLHDAGLDIETFEIVSDMGHLAPTGDVEKWHHVLVALLGRLDRR